VRTGVEKGMGHRRAVGPKKLLGLEGVSQIEAGKESYAGPHGAYEITMMGKKIQCTGGKLEQGRINSASAQKEKKFRP